MVSICRRNFLYMSRTRNRTKIPAAKKMMYTKMEEIAANIFEIFFLNRYNGIAAVQQTSAASMKVEKDVRG